MTAIFRIFGSNSTNISGAAFVFATTASVLHYRCTAFPSQAEQKKEKVKTEKKLQVYLMDRIAKKPYLNYHSVPNAIEAKRNYRGRRNEEDTFIKSTTPQNTRPKGVPSRLRILALDVPQFKEEAFEDNGVCRIPSEIFSTDGPKFVDGVAPPKAMDKKSTGYYYSKDDKSASSRKERRASLKPIDQKALAKELFYCYNSKAMASNENQKQQQPIIGAEILEGSIMDLNPNNIRRTYTSTSNKMRKNENVIPAKYAEGVADDDEANELENEDESEVEEVEIESQQNRNEFEDIDDRMDSLENERTAPWNQYAWLEEMYLRINGIVPFSAPMHRASPISQWLYGRIFSHTIAPTYSAHRLWMWWWWPSLWSYNRSNLIKNGGVDGNGECDLYDGDCTKRSGLSWPSLSSKKLNRASNKPHAVIADGAALHRVPGSLRFLTKTCRDANVPLFILNDPRSWGSQTHSTLPEAVVDIRRSVTDNVVSHCLDIREGSAFERGRLVGQFEKELSWQARDAARKTREYWKSARRRLERDKCEDWSELNDEELWQKLIERKVLTLKNNDGENENHHDYPHLQAVTSTKELLEICRKCLEEEEKGTKQ